MILNWTGSGMKVIPAYQKDASESVFVTLSPGYMEIDDGMWMRARVHCNEELDGNRIIEEWTKMPRPEDKEKYPVFWLEPEDNRELRSIRVPCTIRDINKPAVITRVVMNTFHVPTLNKWATDDQRPDVVKAIVEQVKKVETGELIG